MNYVLKALKPVLAAKNTKIVTAAMLFCLFNTFLTQAQWYSNGQDPASTKWRQIQTKQFQVIYAEEFEAQAQLLTHWLNTAYKQVDASMASKPRKISVIVHSKTAYSNGMVTWAPRRMELYSTPYQTMGAQDWLQHLVLHEYRHVVQVEKLHQGFTRILSWLMGEMATTIPVGLYVPMWFVEGDAVSIETALSDAGRGRQPEFLQGFKALTMEKGKQKYDRAILGSYKMFVPDHYETGYQIVAMNRIHKKPDVFSKKLDNIGRKWINPFWTNSAGLRDGKRKEKYYSFALEHLYKQWETENNEAGKIEYVSFLDKTKAYKSYQNLHCSNSGIYAFKTSFDRLQEIVKLNIDGSTQSIVKLGGYADQRFSVSDSLIMWTELRFDKRWENRAWSDVFAYNLDSNNVSRVTKRQRLFSPTMHPQKAIFAAVQVTEDNTYALKIIDIKTGEKIAEIPNPENGYIIQPCWSTDGESLVYILLNKNGHSLRLYNLSDAKETALIAASFNEMSNPHCSTQGVYFTGTWTGQNNIYFYNFSTQKTSMLTNAMYGANYATTLNDTTLIFANYTSDGYKPITLNQTNFTNIHLNDIHFNGYASADSLARIEKHKIVFEEHPTEKFNSKPYAKINHLFHFHSWTLPLAIDPIDQKLFSGVALQSQNMLSSSFMTVGADFTPNNNLERYFINYRYEGWYPKFDLYFKTGTEDLSKSIEFIPYDFMQFTTGGSVSFPFKITKGIYYGGIFPSLHFDWVNQNYTLQRNTQTTRFKESITYNYIDLKPELYAYRYRQIAKRDLHPRWGQYLKLGYADARFSETSSGKIGYALTQLYFPGILKHHSILISNNFQLKVRGDENERFHTYYYQNNQIPSSRDISTQIPNDKMYSFSADYRFPLFYPDLRLSKFAYVKRVNMGLFCDYFKWWHNNNNGEHGDTGGSIYMDFNALRYEVNIRLGLQGGINLENSKYFSNLILSFSL